MASFSDPMKEKPEDPELDPQIQALLDGMEAFSDADIAQFAGEPMVIVGMLVKHKVEHEVTNDPTGNRFEVNIKEQDVQLVYSQAVDPDTGHNTGGFELTEMNVLSDQPVTEPDEVDMSAFGVTEEEEKAHYDKLAADRQAELDAIMKDDDDDQ